MAVPSLLDLEKKPKESDIPSLDELEGEKKNPNASTSSPSVSEDGTSVSTDGVSGPPKYEYKWTPSEPKEIPVELAPTYSKTPTGKLGDVAPGVKTVSEVKKEGKEPELSNYISTIGKGAAEHIGTYLQEGFEGMGAGAERAKEGLMMMGGILPEGEVFEKISKGEYGDNVAVKGFVKTLAGGGEGLFAAAMHFTPHGGAITETTKVLEATGLDDAIPKTINPAAAEIYKQKTGTDIKLTQLLFAPVSTIATTAKGEELTGSEEDLALIGDFLAGAAIFGFSKKGYNAARERIVKKLNEGLELTPQEMNEATNAAMEAIGDKEVLRNMAEQKGLKLKTDEQIQTTIDEKNAETDKAVKEIMSKADEFIAKVNESDLSPEQKKIAIDNINKVVARNDPRQVEAKKISEEIDVLKQKDKAIQDNAELSAEVKMAQSVVNQKDIAEKQRDLIELFKKKEVSPKVTNKVINEPLKTEKDAESTGEQIETAGEKQKVVDSEGERLRLRDIAENRVETKPRVETTEPVQKIDESKVEKEEVEIVPTILKNKEIIKGTKRVGEYFNNLVKKMSRDEVDQVLYDWGEGQLNEDGTGIKIERMFAREAKKGLGEIVKGSKAQFINWLNSDAPFNEKIYGKDILKDSEYVDRINRAREAAGIETDFTQNEKKIIENAKVIPPQEKIKESPKELASEQTKTETTAETVLPVEKPTTKILVSPYYDTTIKGTADAKTLRESPEYKAHVETMNNVADKMGIKIKSIEPQIGGFENAEGKRIKEISDKVELDTDNLDKAEEFAAVMGALAKDTQEATIASKYVESKHSSANAVEMEMKVSDIDKTIDALEKVGIHDYTINESTGTISILDFSLGKDAGFENKLLSLQKHLKDSDVKYETPTYRATESRYVDSARRTELLQNLRRDVEQRQGGGDLGELYKQAQEKNEEFVKEKTPKESVAVSETKYTPRLKAIEKELAEIDAEREKQGKSDLRELTYKDLLKEKDELLKKQEAETKSPEAKEQYFRIGDSPNKTNKWELVRKEPFNKETDLPGEEYYTMRNVSTGKEEIFSREDLKPQKTTGEIKEGVAKDLAKQINVDAKKMGGDIVKSTLFPLKEIVRAINKPINKIQDAIFNKYVSQAEDWVAKGVQRWMTSGNKTKLWVSQFFTNWANGISRTKEQTQKKLLMKGKIALTNKDFETATKRLHALVDNDPKSLEHIHRVMDADFYAEKGEKALSYEELSPAEKELHDMLRSINDYVHEYNFEQGRITPETYLKNKGKYISRMYDAFEVPEEIQKFLEEGSFTKNNKMNLDIFKARKELDDFKKEHILKDPVYSTLKRMMQTEVNAALSEYMDFIAADKKLISDTAKPGFTQLNGKGYGALDGKYVPNFIAEDFKGYFFAQPIVDLLYDVNKLYDRNMARQFFKRYLTVFSPTVQLGNASSNIVFAGLAGIDPISFISKTKEARKEIKSKGEVWRMLMENGILGSDILTGDIVPLTPKTKAIVSKMDEASKSIIDRAKEIDEAASELYAGTDNVAKVSAFLALKESGMNDRQAMDRVYESFQNYSTVGKIWDFAAKTPIIGNPFIKFQADLQRIIKNSATKRPLTTAMYLATLNGIANLASNWSNESAEEKEIREGRKGIPKIKMPDFLGGDIPLVFQTPAGEVNLARYISPYYQYDFNDDSPLNYFSKLLPYQLKQAEGAGKGSEETYLAKQDPLLGVWWAALLDDKDFRGVSVSDPQATRYKTSGSTDTEKFLNSAHYIMRSQIPYYANVKDMYDAWTYGTDFYGRDRNPVQSVLNNFVKIQQFGKPKYKKVIENDLNTIQFKITGLEGELKDINSVIDKDIEKFTTKQDEGVITKEQLKGRVDDLEEKRMKRMQDKVDKISELQQQWQDKIMKYESILHPNLKGK
ncbi:MAG: hypothetical protein A2Z57_04020 [Planctomycetes bacterium RIFCSPHIGHO2_12_39_6]|nr:MAG: hypothetical protein A2Z57_04020 [Planctomycetes bacterium RIFCSPHIGHO2_12_39_6]